MTTKINKEEITKEFVFEFAEPISGVLREINGKDLKRIVDFWLSKLDSALTSQLSEIEKVAKGIKAPNAGCQLGILNGNSGYNLALSDLLSILKEARAKIEKE